MLIGRGPSHSPESSPSRPNYTRQRSRNCNSPTLLSNFIKQRDEEYSGPRVPPHRPAYDDNDGHDNDNQSFSLVDGYLPNRSRRLSPIRGTHMNQRIYSGTPSPQMLTDDDEPMPTAVRQRRLPLIGMLPPPAPLRSPEHYSSPYHPAHPARSDLNAAGGAPPSVYYTSTDDIPSPSPSSAHNFPLYGQGGTYGPRLPGAYGWRTSSVTVGYHGNNIIPYSRVPSSGNSAPTVIYAGNRSRPVIRVIRAQPGNVPLSDSDNDEQKWAVV
ncbi:uncoordinated protein 2 [Loa loa]|uniref:Uncoordinated protein 2 n=1 Tax=Loa loa TaxID=7209 RepID=A0A1S0TMW5_LOALO|nr:uncoordinated protein 2 [Loa loa]EFO16966.2 uncoordinated protein 2 [Loa loa]